MHESQEHKHHSEGCCVHVRSKHINHLHVQQRNLNKNLHDTIKREGLRVEATSHIAQSELQDIIAVSIIVVWEFCRFLKILINNQRTHTDPSLARRRTMSKYPQLAELHTCSLYGISPIMSFVENYLLLLQLGRAGGGCIAGIGICLPARGS